MIQQKCAGVITYKEKEAQREYLILHYLSGHWDFPKGKLESGETLIEAAHRELAEETNLQAAILSGFEESLSYVFKEKGQFIEKTVIFFVGQTDQEDVRLSREHVGYLWLAYEQAYSKLTYKNAKEVLNKAENFLKEAGSSTHWD